MIPKPIVNLKYNSKDCTQDFSKYLNSLTFTDYEDEQSDELNIVLNNNDGYFTDLWYPDKGDKLTCTISFPPSHPSPSSGAGVSNYGVTTFDCGTLTIDENSFDFDGSGDTVTIKALATSTNFSVRTTKVKNHSGKTLRQIANEIGSSYGFTVLGEGGAELRRTESSASERVRLSEGIAYGSDSEVSGLPEREQFQDVIVGSIVQKNESDIAFLKRISKLYGYIFNIKDGYLSFIKLDEITNQDPLFNLNKTDLRSLSLTDSATKMYGKCRVQYFDGKTKSLKTYTAQGNTELTDTLNIYKKCNSLSEAQQIAQNALKNGSKEVTGSIELSLPIPPPHPSPSSGEGVSNYVSNPANYFLAGVNFNLTGVGKFEGLYHIKSSTRTIDSNGLRIKGEIQKCSGIT